MAVLRTRGSNVDDVEHVSGGKTFFWKGHYHDDMNTRDTLDTQLNVFEHFQPKLSAALARRRGAVPGQHPAGAAAAGPRAVRAAQFVALDSMNLWIDIARDELVADHRPGRLPDPQRRGAAPAHRQARDCAASREVLQHGPADRGRQAGRVRRGTDHRRRLLRASRLPAGAGRRPDRRRRHLRRRLRRPDRQPDRLVVRRRRAANAMAYGTALASFNVERFGTERWPRWSSRRRGAPPGRGPVALRSLRPG